jgi:cellulose synthase/poly-beta-1,6-N-acetylglucosamine synthase-like glycosyltransferase
MKLRAKKYPTSLLKYSANCINFRLVVLENLLFFQFPLSSFQNCYYEKKLAAYFSFCADLMSRSKLVSFDKFKPTISTNFNISKAIYALSLFDSKLCARNYHFPKYIFSNFAILGFVSYNCFSFLILFVSVVSLMQCGLKIRLIFHTFLHEKQLRNLPKTFLPLSPWSYYSHTAFYMLENFPIFTVLIPLYIEPQKLSFIVKSISRLIYPKSRLDVKLVIEADDDITQKELSLITIPEYFEVIKVPPSLPRTKPKALNYAAQYIKGEYLVIFDAEDLPHPNQIMLSLNTFKNLDGSCVCLQAKLNFYNQYENLLTRMQSVEYFIWFGYLLPGLARIAEFVPLGGTSCYFKVNALRKLGFWDPFNVTEDLDLGIRIHLKGYKTYILNSVTMEEAVISVVAWMNQRSRWIKGFMQSYIVFCCNRNRFNLKLKHKLIIDIFVGMSVFNFLTPIYLFVLPQCHRFIKFGVYLSSAISIIYLVGCAIIVIIKQKTDKKIHPLQDIATIILFPFYFILHTFAAYLALYQLCIQPFKWNKTVHGISRLVK